MNDKQIKASYKEGNSTFEILDALVRSGLAFSDAQWKVTHALKLDDEEVSEMTDSYDNNI